MRVFSVVVEATEGGGRTGKGMRLTAEVTVSASSGASSFCRALLGLVE